MDRGNARWCGVHSQELASWDNWLAVYKPVVWLAQPTNSFLADPLDWWFDVWGVQWGVGVGGWEAGG